MTYVYVDYSSTSTGVLVLYDPQLGTLPLIEAAHSKQEKDVESDPEGNAMAGNWRGRAKQKAVRYGALGNREQRPQNTHRKPIAYK